MPKIEIHKAVHKNTYVSGVAAGWVFRAEWEPFFFSFFFTIILKSDFTDFFHRKCTAFGLIVLLDTAHKIGQYRA